MRFYTSANNRRNKTVGIGGANQGQKAHIRGWHSGVEVVAYPVEEQDHFDIYMTYGSNAEQSSVFIGKVMNTDKGPVFKKAVKKR